MDMWQKTITIKQETYMGKLNTDKSPYSKRWVNNSFDPTATHTTPKQDIFFELMKAFCSKILKLEDSLCNDLPEPYV